MTLPIVAGTPLLLGNPTVVQEAARSLLTSHPHQTTSSTGRSRLSDVRDIWGSRRPRKPDSRLHRAGTDLCPLPLRQPRTAHLWVRRPSGPGPAGCRTPHCHRRSRPGGNGHRFMPASCTKAPEKRLLNAHMRTKTIELYPLLQCYVFGVAAVTDQCFDGPNSGHAILG